MRPFAYVGPGRTYTGTVRLLVAGAVRASAVAAAGGGAGAARAEFRRDVRLLLNFRTSRAIRVRAFLCAIGLHALSEIRKETRGLGRRHQVEDHAPKTGRIWLGRTSA